MVFAGPEEEAADDDKYHRLVVLIPGVQPKRFWYYLLFNQRGVILDRAIRRGTANASGDPLAFSRRNHQATIG